MKTSRLAKSSVAAVLVLCLIPVQAHAASPQLPSCGKYTVSKNHIIAGNEFPQGKYQIQAYGISCSKVLGKNGLFKKFLKLEDQDPLPKPWKYLPGNAGTPKFSAGPGVGFRVDLISSVGKSEPTSAWAGTKQLGSANQVTFGNAVATDSRGNVYVTGSTKGGLDGNSLTGIYDFYLTKYNSDGVKLYTKQLGVADSDTVATAVTTDANDNVYISGYTTGGLFGNTKQTDSTHEVFITKYDKNGVKQFTRQLGVDGEKKIGIALAVDANGNFFVAGYTTGALDGYSMTGTVDSFFSKYNSDGVKQFTRLLGVADKETRGYGVTTDAKGNVIVAGYTEGSLDGNTLSGSKDFFVAKYDNNGVKQFTRQLGAVGAATVGTAVTTDDAGDIFTVGYTEGSLDGNARTGTRDSFVTKYDPNGVKQFTRQMGAVGAITAGNEVATDSIGDVFIAGSTNGGLDGNTLTGLHDFFVTKYSPRGVKQFTRQMGVAGRETYGNGVATDSIGDVFVAGSTNGGLDGNTPTGAYDFFVTKFTPKGVKK